MLYIYGDVPPEPVIVTDPFVDPKHETFVWLVTVPVSVTSGCEIITAISNVQRFAS
jgi:hypothetical protein